MKQQEIAAGLRSLGLPRAITADEVERLANLCELLETGAVPRGYLGSDEIGRIVPRHVLESAALLRFIPGPGRVVDVGSGAGLPGLVLACLWTQGVTLVEAQAKRCAFLREAVHELGIGADVVQGRAEDLAHGPIRESFVFASARGLAPPAVALELTLPFVLEGGIAAILIGRPHSSGERGVGRSGPSPRRRDERGAETGHRVPLDEGATAGALASAAETLGGAPPEAHGFEVPGASARRWVMIVRKLRSTPDRYPRSAGALRRRPPGNRVT